MKDTEVEREDKTCSEKSEISFTIEKLLISGILILCSFALNLSEMSITLLRVAAAIVSGYGLTIKAVHNLIRGELFDENTLMVIASLTAFIIGESFEGAIIVALYDLGELLEDLATDNAYEKIAGLAELKCETVNLVCGNEISSVAPENVETGSLILVKKGDRVPIDGEVYEGTSDFDLKAVTGESRIYTVEKGCYVYSGAINLGEPIVIKTTKLYKDSTVERIIELVDKSAERKAKSQKFITSFAKIYTPCVVFLAIMIAIIPPFFDRYDFSAWIYKALSFLIISCPCALVISVPLCFFIGIGSLSKRGILVKGGNYVDSLAKTGIAVFDKTGTLTSGNFSVKKITAYNGRSESDVLKIAASLEKNSSHPIARAIVSEYADEPLLKAENVKEISGKGISATISGKKYSVGTANFVFADDIENRKEITNGNCVFVSEGGALIGKIEFVDKIKDESKLLVDALKKVGVYKTVILSGDAKSVAESVASEIGVGEVYSELLPESKANALAKIISKKGKKSVLYCGDGINDSPSIAMADVGVAMGALGSDAAIESADMVIVDDDLLKIPYAIKRAKIVKRKVWINIVAAISVKIAVMVLSTVFTVPLWLATVGDVGIMLLTVLNSLTVSLYK